MTHRVEATKIIEVIGASRKSLAQTYADLHRVDFVVRKATRASSLYDQAVTDAARTLLQHSIHVIIAVHDNLQRAELLARGNDL